LWLVGMYSLIFTDGGAAQPFIGSLSKAFVPDMGPDSLTGDIPEAVYFMFQMTFAIITPALIVGAFAERMKFSSMMLFSALWALLVYVPVCHWVWGGGWLADMGVMDFAGGIVIHITAGVSALVAALVMGNRKGFPTVAMPPHNMPMVVTGAGMLWVGWFGFNAGSALAADGSAGMAMLVTHISAAAGSLTWMVIEWVRFGKPSVLGIVCFYAVQIIKRHLHIDDSLDVFPVHGVGGIAGSILTGVFAAESLGGRGLGDVTIAHQVGVQALAVGVTIIWTVVFTYIILKVLDAIMGLRVSEDQEVEGLDVVMHEETGYHNM